MTVEIPVKLHNRVKEEAGRVGLSQNEYTRQLFKGEVDFHKAINNELMKIYRRLGKQIRRRVAWRGLAIAIFVGLMVCIALLGKLNKDYIKLFNEGVPVSEDVSMVQYYKAIISNKCKIEAR